VTQETNYKCPPWGAYILEDAGPGALKWFQTAELKHGRVAMVATLGFMVQKWGIHFPLYGGPTGSNGFSPASDAAWYISKVDGITFSDIAAAAPLDAIKMVPLFGIFQIFLISGWFELIAAGREQERSDIPGNFGFDPLGFTKREGGFDSQEITSLRLKELKNGRLAMIAIAGWVSDEIIPGSFPLPSP